MRCFRSFVSILMLIVTLSVGPLLLPAEAVAQNEFLSQAAISEYTAKLAHARNIQAEIANSAACLEKSDAELTSRSNALEKELGDLRRREQDLGSQLETRQAQHQSFRDSYKSEREHYENLEKELADLRAKKDEFSRDCKRTPVPNFLCDAANEVGRFVGLIKSVEDAIAASERQLQIVREGMDSAAKRLQESQAALAVAQAQEREVEASVHQTENQIQRLKAALSDLRTEVQNYRILLDDFANALAEANSVDIADARASTSLQVTRISTEVDAAIAHAPDVVNLANSVLPEGWRQNCSPR